MKSANSKILICSTSIANYDRRLQRIIKTLSQEGYSITWISRVEKKYKDSNCHHDSLNPFFKSGFLFYAFFNIRLFVKLLVAQYDILYSVDLDTVLPSYLASKFRRKKIIFDAHEFFTEVPELTNRKFVKWVWNGIANFCLPNIKYNITVGPKLGEIFTERYNQNYTIIRNVPILNRELILNHSDGVTMVYLGMVNEGRGLEIALNVLQVLKQKYLKIIGGGDSLEEMKKLALELGVEERVEFCGFLAPEQIKAELSNCWIALNMLKPISKSYFYSLANKFFDYIHALLPSVNMAFPEYEVVNKNYNTGQLIENYDANSLIEAVKALENSNDYNKCIEQLKQARLEYNWEVEAQVLIDFMSKMSL